MTNGEIVDILAREGRVEEMLRRITRRASLSPELRDLAQMVYLILLEYRPDLLSRAWANNEINFLIARLILNNLSPRGQWYALFVRYTKKASELTGIERSTEGL